MTQQDQDLLVLLVVVYNGALPGVLGAIALIGTVELCTIIINVTFADYI